MSLISHAQSDFKNADIWHSEHFPNLQYQNDVENMEALQTSTYIVNHSSLNIFLCFQEVNLKASD